jgi:potassium-transporting ATPase KdpC subunit
MRRMLLSAFLSVIFFTVVLGLGYGLAFTGVAQVLFPGKADGSKVSLDGRLVGSSLIAQEFSGREYFQPRPSQTGYSPNTTYFSNRGPNSAEEREETRERLAEYLKLNKPHYRSLTAADVPVDAITTSGSGVDPEISEANALIQAHRIAAVRDLPLAEVEGLIADHTGGRFLGVFGEPGVNVLELNIALDKEAPVK